jgi:membrane protease YdiL (CAAX protease family)
MEAKAALVPDPVRRPRDLSAWQFLALVIAYLAVIQGGGRLIGHGIDGDDGLKTAENFSQTMLIPIALSALLAIVAATWLRWWPEIVHDRRPVQRWVRIVPLSLLIAALVGASWGNLLDQDAELVLLLVALVCLVGFTEELMFRGIGLVMFRRMGLTEGKAALYSSVAFGAVHLSNALATGATAIFQATVVSFSGYLFYLTRRWATVIWPAMLVHASQDFTFLSGQLGEDAQVGPQVGVVVLVMIALAILLWCRRDRIEAAGSTA